MRYSAYFLFTTREDPAEAEIVSHKLMLRAGMIRKVAAGIYSLLPFGLRAVQRLEKIIREEMDRSGAQEVFLPALQPAELWQSSGRWALYGDELMRLSDRHDRNFCLGPTHEEVITSLVAGEVRSYRQLPLNLYQIQTKFRDEIRPRFGVMRGREFSMKDAYSFDKDESDAEKSYRVMYKTYQAIFSRCGLRFKEVEADSGPIGGSFSHEFMVLAETGEDAVISCSGCSYAANMEKAELPPPPEANAETMQPMEKVSTPEMKTIEQVSAFLKVPPSKMVKTLIYQTDNGPVAILVRGDHQLNEVKVRNFLKSNTLSAASPDDVALLTGAPVGYAGPVGFSGIRIIADRHVSVMINFVAGANENDTHLVNVNIGRDFNVEEIADLKQAQANDACPRCGKPLTLTRGIEVGHVFKLGTKYSEMLQARFLDETGKKQDIIMGCYGIGIGRTIAASIEQNHDSKGIIWPIALAPFQVIIVTLKMDDPQTVEVSEKLYHKLHSSGWDVLWDDRDERPGVKFKDAELIGIPLRITIGPRSLLEEKVEVNIRHNGEQIEFGLREAPEAIDHLLRSLLAAQPTDR